MKLNKFATFAVAVAVMAFGFVACNNDSNNEVQKDICSSEVLQLLSFKTLQDRISETIDLSEHSNLFYAFFDEENSVQTRNWCSMCQGNNLGCPLCNNQHQIIEREVNKEINLVIFSITFGRLNEHGNCVGRGFCRFTWFPGFGTRIVDDLGNYVFIPDGCLYGGLGSILEFDNATGQFYFKLLLSEHPPSNISSESLNFYIDDEIFVGTEEFTGYNLVVEKGVHPFNPNLGTAGGYRIPLAIQ